MAHELPPPAVMRSQRNMSAASNGATNDAFGNTDEWQPIDYWYNSPSAGGSQLLSVLA